MALRLTATTVKSFFQYRCERQVRYMMMSATDRQTLSIQEPPDDDAVWARVGIDFEEGVVTALSRRESVLRPPRGEKLTAVETAAFLRGERPERYAHQPRLALSADEDLRRRWQVPPAVELAVAYPDLLRVLPGKTASPVFRLIDVKAVQVPALFHKIQVAYYSLLLDAVLREAGLASAVDAVGEIWHFDPQASPGEVLWQSTPFRLKGYQAQVADFLRGPLDRIAHTTVSPDRDDTRFHLYFKCEQCDYLSHCLRTVDDDVPRPQWDVSAVPGLSQTSKQTLVELGIRTVGDLAAHPEVVRDPAAGWALHTRGPTLVQRANALLSGHTTRLEGRLTQLLPPRLDVGLYLVFDHDPVEGRLAALGCLREQPGRDPDFTVAVVTQSGPAAERAALWKVLSAVVGHLDEVDRHNCVAAGSDPRVAHLIVYEPSEARDLAEALGRHLGDAQVRSGLLHLVRMFPPEPLHPDPEYAGHRHLPATALRSVFDALYAVPARVSHDLARVCAALAAADPPLQGGYTPADPFRRVFSSRLSIDICRELKAGRVDPTAVEADVRARLRALAALTRWLLAESADAPVPFLRLRKEPFRWQASFDPLTAGDLQVLEAQELLAGRASELAVLTALAEPVAQRKERFACLGPLTLVRLESEPAGAGWAAVRLHFRAPADCRQCELGPGSFGVVLTDGDPDLLLDPARWPELSVSITGVNTDDTGVSIQVDVNRRVWRRGRLERLLAKPSPESYYLDQAHADENTPRVLAFLKHLEGRHHA